MIEKFPMPYHEQLKDQRWINLTLQLKCEAEGVCEDCRVLRGRLDTHHTAYIPAIPIWEHPRSILMVICPECHEMRQRLENTLRFAIGRITRRWPYSRLNNEVWRVLDEISRGSESISIPCNER